MTAGAAGVAGWPSGSQEGSRWSAPPANGTTARASAGGTAGPTGPKEALRQSASPTNGTTTGAGTGGTHQPREPRASIDLQQCAASFPAYLSYLNRRFGNRTVDAGGKLQRERKSDAIFGIVLLPNGSVVFEVMRRCLNMAEDKAQKLAAVMNGVLSRHGDVLRGLLQKVGGRVRICWRGSDDPFTQTHVGLPLHGWSSDPAHSDIAMPDFTFQEYAEIGSTAVHRSWTSNSWRDVYARLQQVKQDKRGLVWRGGLGIRPLRSEVVKRLREVPARLAPLLQEVAPAGINVEPHAGTNGRISIYEQCRWVFTLYLPGYHYSASLKYKLACGQTIIFVRDKAWSEEFFYDALRDGENVHFVRADLSDLWEVVERALRQHVEQRGAVGLAARRVAETYLSERGIDCYVLLYLHRYYLPFVDRTWDAWEKQLGTPRPSPGNPRGELEDFYPTPHRNFDRRYQRMQCRTP